MTWTKRIHFTGWPVGQGLFTQTDIWVGTKFLRLVYDCGTFSPSRRLTATAFEAIRNRCIDLLVVSHFHWDHISRIPELLKNSGEIREVWIPYLSPEQRLLFAFSTAMGGVATENSGPDLPEVVSLAAGGREWFESRGCLVREVGGELPGSDNSPPDIPPLPEPEGDPRDSEPPETLELGPLRRIPGAFNSGSGFSAASAPLAAKSSGRYFEAPVELLTWVLPIPDEKTKMLLAEMEKWFDELSLSMKPDDLLQNNGVNTGELSKFISALGKKVNRTQAKEIYNRMNSDLNAGSLFLLVRPTQTKASYSMQILDWRWHRIWRDRLPYSPAVVWTGDAPATVLEKFINEAGANLKEVTSAAIIHQVPHHGSAGSVSSQWLNEIGKHFYVMSMISAGRSNIFGHPSPEAFWRSVATMISEGSYPFDASYEWR